MPRHARSISRPVSFSNLDKRYFPSGFTKGDMIRYYVEIAPYILPHLANRPVTLIRFPDGVRGGSFYEKNAPRHAPEWITTFRVARRHHEGHINYILINNAETLAWCANLGAIEFHPFLHCAPDVDTPTHIAFDLDPGEGSDIFTCIEVAAMLKEVFDGLGLESHPKVSGSKGVQVYVPLNTPVTYAGTQPFAKSVAELLERQHPDLIVSAMSKKLRRGKVMIDWSQNSASKTTVCVYSMRGKHDEPFISMPLSWPELMKAAKTGKRDALFFTPAEALERVRRLGDIFAPVLSTRQRLPDAFMALAPGRSGTNLVNEPAAGDSAARQRPPAKAGRGSLRRYAAKRDFTRTAEPAAHSAPAAARCEALRFVIQKHAASHLHYDFRLELKGTLKSWAVPKGPPYELGVKRAAFEVEDHPIDYLQFEGTIPKGQYGGGTVMVWDIGTYELLGGSHEKGDLKLRLQGRKLKGEWHIFRIKSDSTKPMWLLAKSGVAAKAVSARQDDRSVLTGRSMAQIARANDKQWQSNRASAVDETPAASVAARRTKKRPAAKPRSAGRATQSSHKRSRRRRAGV